MDKVWTKEEIGLYITLYDNWLYRGVVAIYNLQTADEQTNDVTHEVNGVGFNKFDAEILSSFARQIQECGTLSFKQRDLARKKMRKYAGQLERIANRRIG